MTNPHINPEKTYALVVGIEKYTAGSDWNLNGPANDAIQFANWLLDKGVKSENIYLFVSPLNENRDLLNRRNIKAQAANGKNIYNIVISKLLGENAVGELLYVFWGGHGYKVNSKNTRRILWYSDTDNENCKSLDIKSLTEALKTSFQNKGFATQIYFIDTCAISVGHEHDLILKWESSTDDFTPNGRESRNEQFVLFASPEDEAAINDNKAGSGSFSSVVMNELKQLREGCFLPADLAELTKKVTEQSTQKPVYFWVHKLDGSEEEWVNSPIKSSGATSTTLITTPLNLDNWVGREDDINQLQTWLANTEVKTIGIQGFGGVGKSTLAVYLYEKTDKAGFEGKFWANVSLNTNFTVFAEKIITKFGGQVTDRGDINELVNDLLNCLNERRYLLVVDNLETLLNKSRQWQDSGYKQFFESWLKQGRKSTVLLTTQVKPILFQPESWWYLLKGMKISDGVKLLRKFQIQGSSPEKETAELEAFVNSVDGHPLILELVAQYLRAYCNNQLNCVQELRLQQFQLVDNGQRPNWENPDKCLSWILKKHFQRLNQNQKDFLLNLSVYRQPFSNEAARCMLTSDEKKNDRHLQELFSCSFLLKTEDGKYLFQLFVEEYVHQVIDEQSKDLTPAHWEAFNYYISHRKELSLEKTIEDVTEYLEAFYHLCQLKEYAKAYRLLRYFAQFVSAWGYYSILVDRYEKLMEKRLLFTEQLSQQDLMDLFITLGSLYVYIGNSEQAIKYHQESLSIARELGDRQQEAGSLCNLGHSYSLQGQKQDYEQAIKCYQQALPISREIGHREFEGNTLGGLGSAYNSLGEYQQAIKYYQQSWDISKEIDHNIGKARSSGNLGSIYQSLKQHQKAILFFERKLKFANSSKNLNLQASALHSLGNAFDSLQDYQKAIEYYQKALPISQQIGNRSTHGSCLCDQGSAYRSLEKYQEAIECYQQALPILQQIGHREFEANTLCGLGNTYLSLGQYQEALKYYEQWVDIAQKIGDKSKEVNSLDALCHAYESLEKWEKVIEYRKRVVIISHEMGNKSMEGGSLCDLGHGYSYLKRYEEAIESYEKALLILRAIGHREFEANTLSGLGKTYESLGKYQEALKYYKQVQDIAQEIDYQSMEALTSQDLASAYQSLGEWDLVIECLERAVILYQEIGNKSMEARTSHYLASAYKSLGKWDLVIECLERAVILYQEIGDKSMEAHALDGLVIAYRSLSEWEKVLEFRKRAEILYHEMGNKSMEGGSLCDLGHDYSSLKRYEEAIESYEKALLILRAIGHREFEANTLSGLGRTYESLGKYQEALKYYKQVQDIAQEIDDQSMEALASHYLASAYQSLGEWDLVIECLERAVILYQEIGNKSMEARASHYLASAYKSLGKWDLVIECLERAVISLPRNWQ